MVEVIAKNRVAGSSSTLVQTRLDMADVVSKERRSWMMSRIGPRDTQPELAVRSYLHRTGLRFRLHDRRLPGRPDLVLPKYRAVIFVHGCFWHRHGGCREATMPTTREEFWQRKFEENVARDRRNARRLRSSGWRVLIVWECQTRRIDSIDQIFWRVVGAGQ